MALVKACILMCYAERTETKIFAILSYLCFSSRNFPKKNVIKRLLIAEIYHEYQKNIRPLIVSLIILRLQLIFETYTINKYKSS